MANIKVKFKEAYQDFGAYALLKNVTDKGVLIVDGTEVLNSIADLPTTNTVDGQEKAVIVQNGQVVTTSISNIGGESGGDFIPLSGTTVGNPVTGDIELSQPNESLFLHFKNTDGVGNYLKIKTSDDGGIYSQYKYDDYENIVSANSIQLDNFVNNTTIRLDNSSIMLSKNGNQITIDPASVKGIECNADFSPNITDLDYTQKIYVDTHIAFIPIPTSSTDPGIKGQMAVDATYLYICVDTDTWTRVALAW